MDIEPRLVEPLGKSHFAKKFIWVRVREALACIPFTLLSTMLFWFIVRVLLQKDFRFLLVWRDIYILVSVISLLHFVAVVIGDWRAARSRRVSIRFIWEARTMGLHRDPTYERWPAERLESQIALQRAAALRAQAMTRLIRWSTRPR